MSILDGPSYWCDRNGLCTFEDFQDAVQDYMPTVGIGLVSDQGLASTWSAYNIPFSGAGLYAGAVLGAKQFGNPANPGETRSVLQYILQQLFDSGELMPALVIPNVYRVAITAASGGQDVVNVIGVRGTAPGQEAAAAAAVKSAWETSATGLGKLHMTAYVVATYSAMDLSTTNGGISVLTSTMAGTTGGSLATNGACALLKWNGGTRSRTTRGRMYWGPLGEGQIDADGRTLAALTKTALQTACNAFISSLSGASFPLVVVSRKSSTSTLVSTASVETVIATQRRRIRS
jgi:hypothetical protein